MNVTVTEKRVDEVAIAAVEGRLDATSSPEFDRWYGSRPTTPPTPRLVLDFSRLDYVSSAGLRSLLAAAKKARAAGTVLEICGASELITEVLAVSGFLTIFTVYKDEREALTAKPRA
jgi:anti-anti-sigma factor